MGRKRTPGLYKRYGIWRIDKKIHGQRLCESTGTSDLEEAEKMLAYRCETIRQQVLFGVRPNRTFREAATKYLQLNQHKASIAREAISIKFLDKYIGKLFLPSIHMGSLEAYIKAKSAAGAKNRTVNYGLQVVRQILNCAASEWLDEHGQTWLQAAPKIKLLSEHDKREPYPLNWEEQHLLFKELPQHLEEMALFAVNTGCRDQEICQLQWDWEVAIPELSSSVFVIPGKARKNSCGHVVVLNSIASSVIKERRGKHAKYVFTYRDKALARILNSAWKRARVRVNLKHVRVHDLRHTFGRRLRAAGVGFEDRQDLLGHKSSRVTTHYSAAEVKNLLIAAEKVCRQGSSPTLSLMKRKVA